MAEALSWAGANLVLTATDRTRLDETAQTITATTGGEVAVVATDIADSDAADEIVAGALAAFGAVDVVVNNAGINLRGSIGDLTRAEFERSTAVNLTGAWALCRAARHHLASSDHGRVINVSSTFGLVGAADRTPYATSKGALIQLTRALALEWAKDGTTVNAIAPGPFLTEMNIPYEHSEHAVRVINQEVAMQRWAEIHEIQGPILFLASDASSYVTGSVLVVDGGWTAH